MYECDNCGNESDGPLRKWKNMLICLDCWLQLVKGMKP